MTRKDAESMLQRVFRLNVFYDEQWTTIEKLLKGERVLLIEKTGFGKSLCFQFPATLFPGITIIFSPLIALMRDQVKKLNTIGVAAECINSEQTQQENTAILCQAKAGKIKILYIAPERQENAEWLEAVTSMNLSMVVVDEAHCISVWGHDFRPAYRRIGDLVKLLPSHLPVLATTATATLRTQNDIALQLGENLTLIRGNLMRENFRLFVVNVSSEDEKLIWLSQNINNLQGTGILYTGTRVNTEIYSRWLEHLNIPAVGYNAGLDPATRINIEEGLMKNKWKCVISTNALGMGIDKPDIRFIIHTQIPQSPVHYYQEIGRAGRDGKPADLILFYNPADRDLPEAFIEGGRPSLTKYHKVIELLKNEPLGERELVRKSNLKQTQVRVIKADLMEQGIIRHVSYGKDKKFEYIRNAPDLIPVIFEDLRNKKRDELEKMIGYTSTTDSRMKYLCDFLGDVSDRPFNNCDNTGLEKIRLNVTPEWVNKLNNFRETYFPVLEAETRGACLVEGVAASFYGVSNVGAALHRSKYESGGEFPDFLLTLMLKAFRKKFGSAIFDIILYVPPTISGDLVRNFSVRLSDVLKILVSHSLVKTRHTSEQKAFENSYLKADNVRDAFSIANPEEVAGKSIILVDDIYDSGATIKEIGRYLTKLGAIKIAPLVIAKTIGGDLNHD